MVAPQKGQGFLSTIRQTSYPMRLWRLPCYGNSSTCNRIRYTPGKSRRSQSLPLSRNARKPQYHGRRKRGSYASVFSALDSYLLPPLPMFQCLQNLLAFLRVSPGQAVEPLNQCELIVKGFYHVGRAGFAVLWCYSRTPPSPFLFRLFFCCHIQTPFNFLHQHFSNNLRIFPLGSRVYPAGRSPR